MYPKFFKRIFDFLIALTSILVLSPVLLVLMIIGTFSMKGNPFFTQIRPGKNEKLFKMIKFRTMTNKKDENGNLLPDEMRLTKYGKFIRSTSLDELPELFNILRGDMAIVGPRPLLVQYLERYSEEQRHRHDVRPGLTGLAQVNGRNAISWNEKFRLDLEYIKNITLFGDIKIIFQTAFKVFKRDGISSETSATMEEFMGVESEYVKHILIGASGHGKVIADIAKKNGYLEIAFLDDNETITQCAQYPILGKTDSAEKYTDCDFVVSIGNAEIRQKLQERLEKERLSIITLIHPTATIADDVEIGRGTVIMAGAVVNSGAKIGSGCIINTSSSVDHDCTIDDFAHISVGAHVAGTVRIGKRTWVGAGATVINNLTIVDDCMIGAGAVVVKNIDRKGIYKGVPARCDS